jgi:iron complex outermembrane receptor protein
MTHLNQFRFTQCAALLSLALMLGGPAFAEEEVDLASFDLEDLLSMEVTSVSKKAELAFEAPGAVFVITNEDIRRSGLESVPELLRMVPGVQVAQLNSSYYSISLRGFAGTFASKLLVLIDGRSVYTPLFAGVFWDVQDTPLSDVDRIEVIRGPGGTVWGANAVNGVINIVTKKASETQGWHVEIGSGNYDRVGAAEIRYGGNISDDIDFRAYFKQLNRDKTNSGQDVNDAWDQLRTGFRMDAKVGDDGEFTLQGDLYDGTEHGLIAGSEVASELGGGNVLARYTHKFSDTQNASVQFYYDRTDRNSNILIYELDTFDVELKHQFAPISWLDIVWGGEYRHRNDSSKTANPASFDPLLPLLGFADALLIAPGSRKTDLYSGFIQAEGRAFDDQVRLTIGTKLEDNDYSGFEIQPSARLAYVPSETMTLWGSVSRAVRTPSRANDDVTTLAESTNGLPYRSAGSRGTESEDLMAYEAGIRVQPLDWLHFDLAAFYNDYDDLLVTTVTSTRLVDLSGIGAGPFVPVAERKNSNDADGWAWGFEFFTRVEVPYENEIVKKWWIDGTYSYIDVDVDRDGGVGLNDAPLPPPLPAGNYGEDDATAVGKTESHHTVGMRSHTNFIYNLEFDLAYSYVSKINDVGSVSEGGKVNSYHRVDLRTAWRPTEHVETSLSVQNVFDGGHKEWNEELFIPATKIPRTIFAKIVLDF